jgi:ribosome maturation factor RimP
MAKKKIEDVVTEMVAPIVEKNEFELVDVEFIKEGSHWYLRLYIDKKGGITLDDCKAISDELSEQLDNVNPIEQSYFLEVSSPGLERPLKKEKDFVRYKGELVEVKLYKPIEGRKAFEGELIGLINNKICIKSGDSEELKFEADKVSTVRRVIKF